MIKKTYNWVKAKIKIFWKWIIGGVAVASVGTMLFIGGTPIEPLCVDFNGQQICFDHTTDRINEGLLTATDQETYQGIAGVEVMYYIQNVSGKKQNFQFMDFLPDKEGRSVVKIEKIEFDVSYEITVPDYSEVEYPLTCETILGEEVSQYCISDVKECETTIIEKTCVRTEQTGSHQETRYRDEWQEKTLDNFDIGQYDVLTASIEKIDKGNTKALKKHGFTLSDDEFIVLRTFIKYPNPFPNKLTEEFFYEVVGDEGAYAGQGPWYNSSWTYRKEITIDNSQMSADGVTTDSLQDFPLYVPIESDSDIGSHALASGFDLEFTESDGETVIPYEREYFGIATTASASIFVAVDLNSDRDTTSDDTIFVYYGNAGASDGEDMENVWDSSFQMVQHMVDSTLHSVSDSTSNSNDGTKIDDNEPVEATGKIYNAQDFDGGDDYVDLGEPATLKPTAAISFGGWFNTDNNTNDSVYVGFHDSSNEGWVLWHNAGNVRGIIGDGSNDYYFNLLFAEGNLTNGKWHHILVTFDGSIGRIYLDSVEQDSYSKSVSIDYSAVDHTAKIGARELGSAIFEGLIDEVRISNTARSADWIKFEYYNVTQADYELTWGAEETETPAEAEGETTTQSIIIWME